MRHAATFRFLAAGVLALLSALPARAADSPWPVRPIRLIVPFAAGGGTDLLGRLLAARVGEVLGQQIVVDNRGGAGSVLGTQILAKSPADGYTIAVLDTAFAINPGLMEKLPYDAERDFTFVAMIATSPSLLITHPGLKVRTLPELLALAKANPGRITSGSAGVGSSSHLSTEMLKLAAKVDLLHVPFKGAGAAILDLIGGHTDLSFVVPGSVLAQVQAGTVVPLAITGRQPSPTLPNVPTFASLGYPGVDPDAFRFIGAPAGLPAPVRKRLADAIATAMNAADFRTRLSDNGFDPEFLTDEAARAYVLRQIAKWRPVIKAAGVKAN